MGEQKRELKHFFLDGKERSKNRAFAVVLIVCFLSSLALVPSINLLTASSYHECRLWGVTANPLPSSTVLNQLIYLPNSLKALGANNPNGWGLGFYTSATPTVLRGQAAANTDPTFDLAANAVAQSGALVAVGHVRKASSGLVNIPDPHPFERFKNGVWWLFCHNGGIDKTILINLIGTQYLSQNPPTVGSNQNQWIDSELYFIYILKCCEQNNWNVQKGIEKAVVDICNQVPGTSETLNFLLTDGSTLWGFCKGNTLYYDSDPHYLAVASQYPDSSQGSWIAVSNYYLVTLAWGSAASVMQACCSLTAIVKDSLSGRIVSSANVYLDGVYVGKTDSYGKLLQNVIPGLHTLTVSKTGYQNGSATVSVSSDNTITILLKRT